MNQEILGIVISGLSIIVTGLCSWAVTTIVSWLNNKIKDEKLVSFLTRITNIVTDAVMAIYQEFVEVLKKEGKFDEAAQKEAKERAIAIINSQLTTEMKEYIETNFGEIESWLSEKIEAVIYGLKKGK